MLVIALYLVFLPVIFADISKIEYPHEVRECLKSWEDVDTTKVTGERVATSCMSLFSWHNDARLIKYVPDSSAEAFIRSMSKNQGSTRVKRGTFPTRGRPRNRKEYRLLSNTQRAKYHECMNLLRNTKVPGGNQSRYDVITDMHNSISAKMAHGGVNFLSWHRVYLYTLENALRAVDPTCRRVTLPYWDCTAEYYANELNSGSGELSVIFTDEFAGNANGEVTSGHYKDWGLIRNIGNSGSLFGREAIDRIKTRENHGEIGLPYAKGNPKGRYNLELMHNRIHTFVGGFLLKVKLAPKDPIFFLLHTFIDFIWEEFRQSLISRGLDAEEYPTWIKDNHAPDMRMEGFPEWTNEEGYSNQWHKRIVQYEPSFNCDEDRNCQKGPRKNPWLTCQSFPDGKRCTAVPVFEKEITRRRRDIIAEGKPCQNSTYPKVQICDRERCPYTRYAIQNTFALDDVIDTSKWVYIPVNIISERSQGLQFNTYDKYTKENGQGQFIHTKDAFDPTNNEQLNSQLHTGAAASYGSCRISADGAFKVFVRADGVSYSGNSMEYAIIDARLPVMSQKAFIPIKNPESDVTEVCLMAYDECGRLCLPTCLVKGSSPSVYKPCSGCIRVDSKTPKRYGHTIADVIATQWQFRDVNNKEYVSPSETNGKLFLQFVCDASFRLPWQRGNTV